MAKQILANQRFLLDGYEITTDIFAAEAALQIEDPEGTTFGTTGVREFLAGLKRHSISYAGRWQAGTTPDLIDGILFARTGVTDVVASYMPITGAEGEVAYTTRVLGGTYTPFDSGEVGTVHNFRFLGQSEGDPLVRGAAIHVGAEVATGNGTEYTTNLGAVVAGQSVYGGLHVYSVTGAGTIDVLVQHDTTGFGSPTTALTFAQQAAIGSDWQTDATATADTYWRATWTIAGFTSVSFDVIIGIWP